MRAWAASRNASDRQVDWHPNSWVELLQVNARVVRGIHVVIYKLNTHTFGSLYEAFPPDEARRIADKLEIHYTPKHGS